MKPGTRVRLRKMPEDTGKVTGKHPVTDEIRVDWDYPEGTTYIAADRLEVIPPEPGDE